MPRSKLKKWKIEAIQLKNKDIAGLREEILEEHQDGLCLICKETPERPCLDHSHKKRVKGTGLVRGVLCSSCNIFIAKSENNCLRYGFSQADLSDILRSMADYLEGEHYPYIHPSEGPKRKILQRSSYNALKKVYTGRARFPEYKTRDDKNIQTLTKPLERLFNQYNIEPEYYK